MIEELFLSFKSIGAREISKRLPADMLTLDRTLLHSMLKSLFDKQAKHRPQKVRIQSNGLHVNAFGLRFPRDGQLDVVKYLRCYQARL